MAEPLTPEEEAELRRDIDWCRNCDEYRNPDYARLLATLDVERARTVVLTEKLSNAANWLTPVPGRPYCACTDSGLCLAHAHVEEIRGALAVLPVDRVGVEPLDVAWAAAEKALPDGWQFYNLTLHDGGKPDDWEASASHRIDADHWEFREGTGSTPTAALQALATHLIESPTEGET